MTKYLLKKHYEATAQNEKFSNAVIDYYEGVNHTLVSENKEPNEAQVDRWGYETLAGAKKALKAAQELAEWETEKGFWNVTVELYTR